MFMRLATSLFGSSNERTLRRMQRDVVAINALEAQISALDDTALKAKTDEFKQRLAAGETLDDIMHEAFAVVREASKRTMGMRHFDVQLIGGVTLHRGSIAEMRTGEGKTLVATLAVYLNALSGKGVHVITVNDYLAQRDAQWMGQLYGFLGLSIGCIIGNMSDDARRTAYACDITYGTNNEFGFDYLRDNMKFTLADMVQRPFNFAIVDEVDSILIDEARTPLIISGAAETATDLYVSVNKIIPLLIDADFELDEKMKTVVMTEAGVEHVEQLLREAELMQDGGLYDVQNMSLVHHINSALRAHKLFNRDTQYIVRDNKVIIIDEFTGRMMDGRRFSEGLHQALEAKENVQIQNENQTLASITFQNYFRLYPKLAGMTGTGMTEAGEFAEIYNLGVVDIPTNVPVARRDMNDKIYKSIADKQNAIIAVIEDAQKRGQPVLVGTVSIEKSETLSEQLKKHKITHQVLNARYHEQEAAIISQAGRPGAVTIATNMAGRGTDIQLGGNLDMLIKQDIPADADDATRVTRIKALTDQVEQDRAKVKEAGGLMVIGTERHESRRIDNQLRGRSGRQGDPGLSIFFLSAEDDLMRIFSPETLQAVLSSRALGLKDGEALEHPMLTRALEKAQARVEGHNFDIRKSLLKFDNIMNDQRKIIYEQRRQLMESASVHQLTTEMRHDVIERLCGQYVPSHTYVEEWDIDGLAVEVTRVLSLPLPIVDWAKEDGVDADTIHERIRAASDTHMDAKMATAGEQVFAELEKMMVLQMLDQHWKEHLLNMDHLRTGINLRAYGQRDPVQEYRLEAFGFFEQMLNNLREAVVENLSRIDVRIDAAMLDKMIAAQRAAEAAELEAATAIHADPAANKNAEATESKVVPFRNVVNPKDPATWASTPRNSACPCGSGKKYKHCHGALK
ncbi:MAG: preprotein translocase subunit SecA [Pseudomonadota bacterium]